MTQNKHLKDTISLRRGDSTLTYQQARREILTQLQVLESFTHLPVVWEIARTNPERRPTLDEHRSALGAAELALRDTGILEGATDRDRCRTIDGPIDLDWHGGPFAYEVVRALLGFAEDPARGRCTSANFRPASAGAAIWTRCGSTACECDSVPTGRSARTPATHARGPC